jgi:hypothetical protein
MDPEIEGIGHKIMNMVQEFFRALKVGDTETAREYWNLLEMEIQQIPAILEAEEDSTVGGVKI